MASHANCKHSLSIISPHFTDFIQVMALEQAKSKFSELLLGIPTEAREDFVNWLKNSEEIDDFVCDPHIQILESIAETMRTLLPLSGILSTEKVMNSDNPHEEHIDAFLFSDDVLDELCDEGKMSRHYCTSCGSKTTQKLELISHSFSSWELKWLFTKLLPDLTDKVILDVGSRLGCVLYAASEYTEAARIVGVEMSQEMCALQQSIVEQYKYSDRVEIVCSDIRAAENHLKSADVIILNNVFEHFMSNEDQMKCWDLIFGCVKRKGVTIVTVPSLEDSLEKLTGGLPDNWVQEQKFTIDEELVPDECDMDALEEIHIYTVM